FGARSFCDAGESTSAGWAKKLYKGSLNLYQSTIWRDFFSLFGMGQKRNKTLTFPILFIFLKGCATFRPPPPTRSAMLKDRSVTLLRIRPEFATLRIDDRPANRQTHAHTP